MKIWCFPKKIILQESGRNQPMQKLNSWDSLLKANPAVFTLPFISQLTEVLGTCNLRKQMLRRNLIAIHKYAEGGKREAIERKKS